MQLVPGGLERNPSMNLEPSTPTTNKTGSTTGTDHHIKPQPFPASNESLDVTDDENMPTKKGSMQLRATENETKASMNVEDINEPYMVGTNPSERPNGQVKDSTVSITTKGSTRADGNSMSSVVDGKIYPSALAVGDERTDEDPNRGSSCRPLLATTDDKECNTWDGFARPSILPDESGCSKSKPSECKASTVPLAKETLIKVGGIATSSVPAVSRETTSVVDRNDVVKVSVFSSTETRSLQGDLCDESTDGNTNHLVNDSLPPNRGSSCSPLLAIRDHKEFKIADGLAKLSIVPEESGCSESKPAKCKDSTVPLTTENEIDGSTISNDMTKRSRLDEEPAKSLASVRGLGKPLETPNADVKQSAVSSTTVKYTTGSSDNISSVVDDDNIDMSSIVVGETTSVMYTNDVTKLSSSSSSGRRLLAAASDEPMKATSTDDALRHLPSCPTSGETRRTVRTRSHTGRIVPTIFDTRLPMANSPNVRNSTRIDTRRPVRSTVRPFVSNGSRPPVHYADNIRPPMGHVSRRSVPRSPNVRSLMSVCTAPRVNSGSTLRPLMEIDTHSRSMPIPSLMSIETRPPWPG